MKALFIGGTGNISKECAALLHARGHDVTVLGRAGKTPFPGCPTIRADRHNLEQVRAALADGRWDVVLNFLGYDLPELKLDFEVFHDRIQQYVFISSATVYARPARLPITEDAPLGNAFWEYAQKKLACERWLLERFAESRFPVTIVRPSHTYSRRWIPNPVSSSSYNFAARLERGAPVFVMDDGENPWTLTAASDFAVGLAGLVGKTEAIGQAYHITSDEVLTWNQIYQEIATALGVSAPEILRIPTEFICRVAPQTIGPLKGDKANPGIFDNTKIRRLVPEFHCRKPFATGVRESVAWLRTHPECTTLNPATEALLDTVITAWKEHRPSTPP